MRQEYWKGFDNNGNGYVSLAETEKGIRDVIKLDNLFDAKPAIMRAFQFAKDALPGKSKYGADYIEKKEFRIFLVALRQRFEYFQAFKRIDSGVKLSTIRNWLRRLRGRGDSAALTPLISDFFEAYFWFYFP